MDIILVFIATIKVVYNVYINYMKNKNSLTKLTRQYKSLNIWLFVYQHPVSMDNYQQSSHNDILFISVCTFIRAYIFVRDCKHYISKHKTTYNFTWFLATVVAEESNCTVLFLPPEFMTSTRILIFNRFVLFNFLHQLACGLGNLITK